MFYSFYVSGQYLKQTRLNITFSNFSKSNFCSIDTSKGQYRLNANVLKIGIWMKINVYSLDHSKIQKII